MLCDVELRIYDGIYENTKDRIHCDKDDGSNISKKSKVKNKKPSLVKS
jgi:hypothetical protein